MIDVTLVKIELRHLTIKCMSMIRVFALVMMKTFCNDFHVSNHLQSEITLTDNGSVGGGICKLTPMKDESCLGPLIPVSYSSSSGDGGGNGGGMGNNSSDSASLDVEDEVSHNVVRHHFVSSSGLNSYPCPKDIRQTDFPLLN